MDTEETIVSAFHVSLRTAHDELLLQDITVDLAEGQWSEIVGPTSAGKSLLFSIFSLRQTPSEGHLLVGGRNLSRLSATAFAKVRQEIGSCAQRPLLLRGRTSIENLVVPLVVRGRKEGAREKAEELLERAGIAHLRDRAVAHLNAREARIVGSLRAMIDRPRLILLDGVLEEVDADTRTKLIALLEECQQQGSTVILWGRSVLSDATDRRVLHLQDGCLTERTSPTVLPRSPERGGLVR